MDINHTRDEATIKMENHISTIKLKLALEDYPKYQIEGKQRVIPLTKSFDESEKTWFETYKPILLNFGYITTISLLFSLIMALSI